MSTCEDNNCQLPQANEVKYLCRENFTQTAIDISDHWPKEIILDNLDQSYRIRYGALYYVPNQVI